MTHLILIFCLLFTYLAWRRLDLALYVLLAASPAYLIRFTWLGLPLTALELMIGLVVVIAITKKQILWQKIGSAFWFKPAVAILVVATISVFTSPNLVGALGVWKAYFVEPLLLVAVIISVIKKQGQLTAMLNALGLSVVYLSLISFWQFFTGWNMPTAFLTASGEVDRVVSVFGYPNALGLLFGPVIMLFTGWLFVATTWPERVWRLGVITTGFLTLILAESEAAMAAVLLGWLVLALGARQTRHWALLASAVGGATAWLYQPLWHFIWSKILLQDYSGFIRRLIWGETWQMLTNHWLWGAGLAGYQTLIAPYHLPTFEIFLYPHQLVLNFWSELGILGVLAFAWLLIAAMFQNWRGWRQTKFWLYGASLLALGVIVVHGLVDVPYFKNDLAILFWLIICLPTVASNINGVTRANSGK